MPFSLEHLQTYQDLRVKMTFSDDHECIATLLSASEDIDGSLHLVYDKVEWTNDPRETKTAEGATFHAEGESLVSIKQA